MGTDMDSAILTARGTPIQGSSLPGDVWQGFMSAALADAVADEFPPFRPIGEPPSPVHPNEGAAPSPSVPRPTPAAAPAPLPPATDPPPEEPDVPADDPDILGDRGADDPDEDDCSITPCG